MKTESFAMKIETFHDARTSTLTYVVIDESTSDAIVIDPVLDYDAANSWVYHESIEAVTKFLTESGLQLRAILETHAHADHISAAPILKDFASNAWVGISEHVCAVQSLFKPVLGLPDKFACDGSQFDRLLRDGETVTAGSIDVKIMSTPGHTPACCTFVIGDAAFTGDALFMPDSGTGRCDFPKGSAEVLYRSVTEGIYKLPDTTRIFVGHDYRPGGRPLLFESTIADEKRANILLPEGATEAEFVDRRVRKDATLNSPKLLFQSVQRNIEGGGMPSANKEGHRFLKIPIGPRPKVGG